MSAVIAVLGVFAIAIWGMWLDERRAERMRRAHREFFGSDPD